MNPRMNVPGVKTGKQARGSDRYYRLDEREVATVLAALRYYQANEPRSFLTMHEISTDGGRIGALGVEEIDALCERINS